MIDKQTIFEIHRLHHLGWSHRKITRTLGIDRDTVKNYVNDPQRKFNRTVPRSLKLDPFRQLIQKWLNDVANVRIHQSTGQRPIDRFEKVQLNPLPQLLPDCRQVLSLKVSDLEVICWMNNLHSE